MSNITIKDVAKKCKVSVSTVSRAINNHSEISEDTRKLVLDMIKKIGYIPNPNARTLKCIQTNTIAVIIKGIDNLFFQPMFRILENEITKNGYSFLLYKVEEDGDELKVALKLANHEKPKGIIFLGGNFLYEDKKILQKIDIAFVVVSVINHDMNIKKSACIGVDDLLESKKIVNYLLSLGHKKIAFIGSRKDDKSIGMLRLKGYKQALLDNSIKIDEKLIFNADKNQDPYNFEYGYKMGQKILDKKIDFSAIYCISDVIAIGLLKKLREKNIKVPQDISVVGFDGLKINEYLNPVITTIKQPVDIMVLEATNLLFKIISGKSYEKVLVLNGHLQIGQTTKKSF